MSLGMPPQVTAAPTGIERLYNTRNQVEKPCVLYPSDRGRLYNMAVVLLSFMFRAINILRQLALPSTRALSYVTVFDARGEKRRPRSRRSKI